jgi:mono/diheme cytochrome c family protein
MMFVRTVLRAVLAGSVAAGAVAAAGCQGAAEPIGKPAATQSAAKSGATQAAAGAPVSIDRGRTLYKVNCTPCHGDQGKGDGPAAAAYDPKPRNHTDLEYMSKLKDEDIAKVIQYGGAIKGMPTMPSNPALKGPDLAAVVAYTRSLSAHGASAGGAR